jgi:hypothetical protein
MGGIDGERRVGIVRASRGQGLSQWGGLAVAFTVAVP